MQLDRRLEDRRMWSIGDVCSMSRVLELLSTKTSFQIVRELFLGTTRFDDFVQRVGASAPAVSRALKALEAAGVVTRAAYQEEGKRARDEYRLTQAGEDLLPVFLSLVHWGDRHLQRGKPPLAFVDAETDIPVAVSVTVGDDRRAIGSEDIRVRRGR